MSNMPYSIQQLGIDARHNFVTKHINSQIQVSTALILTISCRCECSKILNLVDLNQHLESECAKYKEEVRKAIAVTSVKPEDVKQSINRSTFVCPFCKERNLERKDLLVHVNTKHHGMPGVCPICVVQIYGDPNYVSQNLGAHLNTRHQYDLDTYTEYENEDDAILKRVL